MKASKLCTMPLARSRAASEKPASSTLVLRDGVDHQFLLLLQRQDQVAQRGVGQRLDGLAQRGLGLRGVRSSPRDRAHRRCRAPGPSGSAPPAAVSTLARSASVSCASSRARRAATLESTSGSTLPSATACSSLSSGTVFFWSIGRLVGLVALAHAHAVDDDEVVLVHVLAGVHAAQVVVA